LNILFIESPSPYLIRQHAQVGLGLLYLATIAKEKYEVKFIRPDNMMEIDCSGFDVCCLSSSTLEYPMTCDVAKFIKENFFSVKIFIGGTHATALPIEVLESGLFDSICIGEGEKIILEMLNDLTKDKLKKIYKAKELIHDLDSIPLPDRSLIKGSHGRSIFIDKKTTNENIITSRGCNYRCAYCASQCMWGSRVRFRSVDNVVAEINNIINKYKNKTFRIADDNFTSNKKRCLKLCNKLEQLDIEWRCSIRADSITKEIAKALYNAGCVEISPGIESGDQRVLNFLNKKTKTDRMLIGCENAKKVGINVRALFMIGTPGERKDTPEINKDYLKKLPYDMVTLCTFIPLPGTDIFNNPSKYNCEILTKDYSLYNKDYFILKNGKATKRDYTPLIHNYFLSIEQQADNVRRMEEYMEKGKVNKG